MKKTMLAAVCAMACAGVSAQSYVNIYGRLNVSAEYQSLGGNSSKQMENSSSRWGITGNEDLGGGLKALFLLENGFDVTNGAQGSAGKTWSRESYVGLSSNTWGTVRGGRIQGPLYYATADWIGMHNHDTGTSADYFYGGTGYLDNSIAYKTPLFGGFTAEVLHAFSEDKAGQGGVSELALNYDVGSLHLGGGMIYIRPLGQVDAQRVYALRALYEFGAFTLGGYIEHDNGKIASVDIERTTYRLAGMYAFGNNEVHLNVGYAGKIGGVDETEAAQVTVGYNYNLSKRTKVYAFVTQIYNDDNANYGPKAGATTVGQNFSSWALGVRHNF